MAVDGARALDVPDSVEGLLDVCCQRKQSVEQEDQTDADEDAALGVLQVGLDEVEDSVGNVRVLSERAPQFRLKDSIKAEATGNGKDDGKHRNGSQHTAVGQSRSVVHDVVLGDTLPSNHEPLQHTQPLFLPEAEPLLVDAPYMLKAYHLTFTI